MNMEKKLFCDWDFVRFVKEELLIKDNSTLSVTCANEFELMIFLSKSKLNDYVVRVYKNKPNDKYVSNKYDNVKSYDENDEYATFYFDEYSQAINFVDTLGYMHQEYKTRPIRKKH